MKGLLPKGHRFKSPEPERVPSPELRQQVDDQFTEVLLKLENLKSEGIEKGLNPSLFWD